VSVVVVPLVVVVVVDAVLPHEMITDSVDQDTQTPQVIVFLLVAVVLHPELEYRSSSYAFSFFRSMRELPLAVVLQYPNRATKLVALAVFVQDVPLDTVT